MRLDTDPRLPLGQAAPALMTRLFELFRAVAQAVNARADGFCHATRSVTAAYTMQQGDSIIFANATGGAFTVTVPAAGSTNGKLMAFRKTDGGANSVTLTPAAGQINGAASLALTAASPRAVLASDGTNYYTV